jgi:hypothetical protein
MDKYAAFVKVIILQSIKSQECGHSRITYGRFGARCVQFGKDLDHKRTYTLHTGM